MDLPEKMTFGESLGPAMRIREQQKATEYFEALVHRHMKYHDKTHEEATKITKINLGYYAGYFDQETQRRVEKLFDCVHPIFGQTMEETDDA